MVSSLSPCLCNAHLGTHKHYASEIIELIFGSSTVHNTYAHKSKKILVCYIIY